MLTEHLRRFLVAMICISLLGAAIAMQARAAIVTTDRAISLEQREAYIGTVTAGLRAEDLRRQIRRAGRRPGTVEDAACR